ncbi:MAG: aconitase X catalytic domain-containing protein [Pseudomonadota bacterium]
MRLNEEEQAIAAGALGEPRRMALEQQTIVGRYFGAEDFVPVAQAHLMADGEAVGEAGLALLERLAAHPEAERRVRVPTVTDPRGVDRRLCAKLQQPAYAEAREQRIVAALEAFGCLMTNTCINYQTVMAPVLGEHLAFGDTGSVNYANGVCGARSNFEGGVAALWAGLTGRVPRYGMHLDQARLARSRFRLTFQPEELTQWGALGGVIGRALRSYWDIPVIEGVEAPPGSDALKHLGAALGSFGSTPMFHVVGVTPEAPTLAAASAPDARAPIEIGLKDLEDFAASFAMENDNVDLVVFAAPQISLLELERLASLLDGQSLAAGTSLLAATTEEIASAARRMGLAQKIEAAGGQILEGVCFYQMYAREIGQANGWRNLVTNSAKLANIIGGYGYNPALASMERCVEAALSGRLTP